VSTLLEVSQLSAGYGDVQILWDVSLRVGDGESVAVLGANGVGKSTLLKTMAGLLRPFRGRIRWRNQDITSADPAARVRLGMSLVPEGKRLFVGMTVRENLLMGAFARRNGVEVRRDLERVLILFPALRDKLHRIAGTLSGGEQQMCAIGRGLMAGPRLLFLDELSSGLAPAVTEALLEAVAEINGQGVAVVMVEQDVMAVLSHAHRAYLIEGGRIVMEGKSADLLANPLIKKNYLAL